MEKTDNLKGLGLNMGIGAAAAQNIIDGFKHDHEEKQICDMEHQRERLKRADEHVIEAISKANTALEKLEQLLVENDLRRDEVMEISQSITAVGDTIAKLRQSMNTNTPFYGFAV